MDYTIPTVLTDEELKPSRELKKDVENESDSNTNHRELSYSLWRFRNYQRTPNRM